MKKLLDVAHRKLINIIGRHDILDVFMDVSHTLEMTICVVNQLLLGTVVSFKLTVKISSIFVAFLEKTNFTKYFNY